MTDYTFTVNGVDLHQFVSKTGYQTNQKPVEGTRVTTMDGVDHVAIIRYRNTLTVTINPTTPANFVQIVNAIKAVNPCVVVFTSLQTNTDLTATMTVEGLENAFSGKNASRTILSGLTLTFNQL